MFTQIRLVIEKTTYTMIGICLFACGGTQTAENTEKVAKDVEVSTNVNSGAATTLAINAGSANGTEVTVEDGALEEGSTLSLDRVEQPNEFADFTATNGDGETTFSQASSAIEVTGENSGSSSELASPMTIAIPYSGTTSLTLTLMAIAKTAENICVMHKSRDGELFIFRGKLLQIVSEEKKIKFKSSTFGVYQLFFCGGNSPSGFEDAGEQGISGPPPGSDPSTFSSYGGEATFQLTVDSNTYAYEAAKYCLIIATDESTDESWSFKVVAAAEFTIDGGSMDLNLDLDTGEMGDEALVEIGLLLQSNSQSCNFNNGDIIDSNNNVAYDRSYRFSTNKKALHDGAANGSFGSGLYGLSEQTIKIGSPSSQNATALFAVSSVCVSAYALNAEGVAIADMFLNTEIVGSDGESISITIPNGIDGFADIKIDVHMNSSCEQESFDYVNSYPLSLSSPHSDGNYYLAPVSLGIPETVQTQLAIISNKNVCAELYDGNYTSNNVAQSDPTKSLGLWTLSEGSLTVYIPAISEKMQGESAIFDVLYHLGSDCRSNFPAEISIATNDEDLFD